MAGVKQSEVHPVWSIYEESRWIFDRAGDIDAHTDTLVLLKKVKGKVRKEWRNSLRIWSNQVDDYYVPCCFESMS